MIAHLHRRALPLLLAALACVPLAAQSAGPAAAKSAAFPLGLRRIAFGTVALHDHVSFEFHQPALGDPYPHEFRQGYGFDGADLTLQLDWRWGGLATSTFLRVTPASRSHWAYDQDTDYRPGTNFTHGNAGYARSRTFAIGQQVPLGAVAWLGPVALRVDFLRQWTRYHAVTTYDLNSNPALPSSTYTRLISERAIVEELRPELQLARAAARGPWRFRLAGSVAPLAWISLRNYIPVVLAVSSTTAYGAAADLGVTRRLSPALALRFGGVSRWENGYGSAKHFRREVFGLSLALLWGQAGARGNDWRRAARRP